MSVEVLELVIKTINNETHNVTISSTDSVSNLKIIIRDLTSVNESRQRLIYKGRVLLDNSLICDNNIESGHTIHMVARPLNFQETEQSAQSNQQTFNSENTNGSPSNLGVAHATVLPVSSVGNDENGAANYMEHIRQNLLTLHTLMSTMDSLPVNAPQPSVMYVDAENEDSEANSVGNRSTAHPVRRNEERTRKFFVGQWVDVKDTVSQWLEATILDVDDQEEKIFVHYNGW